MLESALVDKARFRVATGVSEQFAAFGRPDSARAALAARRANVYMMARSIYLAGTDTLPTAAWIDLAEGRPREAAAKFRASLRFLGGDAPSRVDLDAEIGLAFEHAGLADSAVAAYEHYLNAAPNHEIDAFKLVWILEHVAPLYERRGDRAKARAAYARMADLWKDADPELQPRVAHARERMAALSSGPVITEALVAPTTIAVVLVLIAAGYVIRSWRGRRASSR
jgi:tetratricopeptide (TPR) repeat protein